MVGARLWSPKINAQEPLDTAEIADPLVAKHLQFLYDQSNIQSQAGEFNQFDVLFTADCLPGVPVGIVNAAGVLNASPAIAGTLNARGFLVTTPGVVAGQTGTVQVLGRNIYLSGLVPATDYYLSGAGGYTNVPGTQYLGYALDANTLIFMPSLP